MASSYNLTKEHMASSYNLTEIKKIAPVRYMVQIYFERITHGHDAKGMPMQATRISNIQIPDFDFQHLEKWELNEKYGWKNVAVADFVRNFANRSGSYMLDTKTKEVKHIPNPI